jgi:hypothetical protein
VKTDDDIDHAAQGVRVFFWFDFLFRFFLMSIFFCFLAHPFTICVCLLRFGHIYKK